jgi:hypothetical protein
VLFQGRGQQVMKDYLQSIDEICTIIFEIASIYEHLLCYRDVCWQTLIKKFPSFDEKCCHHISYIP